MMGSLLLTCVHYSAFSTQIPNGRLTRPDSSGLLVRASRLNHLQLLCISALLVALVFGKRQFAQANVGGGDFDQLIFLNVLKRLLERHLARGLEDDVLIAAGGAHVGELLGLGGVDDDVVLAAMLAADLAFVAGFAVLDEEDAAVLERVERIAVDGAGHVADHRSVGAAADLAAHVFDEDAQVQQAATADFEGVLAIGLFDLEGDVALEFLPEALAQIAAGNVLAFLADEGRVVDAKHHGERRRLDLLGLEGLGIEGIADRVADIDGFEADQGDDVAGVGFFDIGAAEAFEGLKLLELALNLGAIAANDRDLLTGLHAAVIDAADADAADVVVVLDRVDLDLEALVGIAVGRGNVLEQRLEDRDDVFAFFLEGP